MHDEAFNSLLNDDLSLHSSSLMWLAVVVVLSSNIELSGHSLSWSVEVVLVGEGISVDSSWHGILIEDNVVWESSVVGPGDGVSLGDGHGGWLENEGSCNQNTIIITKVPNYFDSVVGIHKCYPQISTTDSSPQR